MRWLRIYVATLALVCGTQSAAGQESEPGTWTFVDSCDGPEARLRDGLSAEVKSWPTGVTPGDREALLLFFQGQGYLDARVDSVSESPACVARGRRYSLATRLAAGVAAEEWDAELERDSIETGRLDSLMQAFLVRLEREGRIRSTVSISSFRTQDGLVELDLEVIPGRRAVLLGLLVGGRTRTSLSYLERVTGLREGIELSSFDGEQLQRSLRATGLFQRVETPVLLPTSDSTAIVQMVLDDRAPGSFDLALGYLPPVAGRAGTVVGSGSLVLRNLFGGGRAFSVELDRMPGQASSFEAALADPFVLGQNLGAEVSFAGYQQDSTFSRQEYRVKASLGLGLTRLTATAARRVARPGVAGARIVAGRQVVANSSSRMAGFSVSYRATDEEVSPSSGIELEMEVLRGRSLRDAREIVQSDTLRVERNLLQDRLEGRMRWYLPARGLTLALGGDVRVLVSDEADASDLYRLGGASTLRGYDEDRFAGTTVGRALIEVRRRLEGPSYAYLFTDLGYVYSAGISGTDGGTTVHPGFGAGVQLETAAGLLNVSYAVNPEEGLLNGRIHFGIAFGL